MTRYLFRLDTIHTQYQRGKNPDNDVLTFGVQVGTQSYGPVGKLLSHACLSGSTLHLTDDPPDTLRQAWEIGPLEVNPDDIVNVIYAAVNTSDYHPSLSRGDTWKITAAVWGAMIGVGAALGGIGAVAGAVIGGVIAVLGEIIGDITPDDPKCNGVVFADKYPLTGSNLAKATSNPQSAFSVTTHYTDATSPHPDDCGHLAETDVTFTVIAVPVESVTTFLGSRGDLRQGLRRLQPGVPVISVRSLIES